MSMIPFAVRRYRVVGAGVIVVTGWAAACSSDQGAVPSASYPDAAVSEAGEDGSAAKDGGVDGRAPAGTYARLINDDAIWSVVPTTGAPGVELREARVTPDPFPRRQWKPCGSGCSFSPAALPFDLDEIYGATTPAGAYIGNDGFLMMHSSTRELKSQLTRLERLSDGATVAAVVARNRSSGGGLSFRGGSAALVFAIGDGTGRFRFARASTELKPLRWQPRWRDDVPLLSTERFGIGEGFGVASYASSVLFPTPEAEEAIEITPGSAIVHGQGDQLLFGYSTGTLYSFTVPAGVTPFLTLPTSRLVMAVRTSAEKIVWIDGIRSGDGWDQHRWHWSPLVKSPSAVAVNDGPSFPPSTRSAPFDLHTKGDWAICEIRIGPADTPLEPQLYAWNIATGATYVVPTKPGRVFQRALILTPTEMVLGYRKPSSDVNALEELVRIQIEALPDVISRWNAGVE